jgi:thiamine biosynthesis lipoprotein
MTDVFEQCLIARTLSGGWFDPWAMPGGVDPTGYVKGWAAQRSLKIIAASGISGAVVNAAGDVATTGRPSADSAFRVGIQSPAIHDALACVVELSGGIATSGTYERGLHLIDPHSGVAAHSVASASVCGPDLGLADALATALAVGGEDVLRRLEELDSYDGLLIDVDGSMRATSAFPFAEAR